MTSNLPAVILIASLVSCHPAPAVADGIQVFTSTRAPSAAAEPVVFCSGYSPATITNHDVCNVHDSRNYRKVTFVTSAGIQVFPSPRARTPAAALPLAPPPVALYSGDAGPHGQTGLASGYHRRTPRALAGFLCVSCSAARVMAGCMGHPSGWPVPMTGRPTLYSPPPRRLASAGGGEVPIIGVTTMTTPAQNSPAVRHRSAVIAATILLSLSSSRRIGTAEIQQRLTNEGIPVSLRTVQRHLTDLAAVLPIEGDGASPQGWRWKTAPLSLVSLSGGAA